MELRTEQLLGKCWSPIIEKKDKKFFIPDWCIQEKCCSQRKGVTAGFEIKNWFQILNSGTF